MNMNPQTLRLKVIELGRKITGDIEHGECFYESEMLNEFCSDLDKLKEISILYYNENKKEDF